MTNYITSNYVAPDLVSCLSTPSVFMSDVPHPSTSCVYKRTIDILGALIGLAVLAIIFVPLAIAIRLDSSGSIFYKQERYGLRGQKSPFANSAQWFRMPMSSKR